MPFARCRQRHLGAQVWLVTPWRCRLTRNPVYLKLLKRAAEGAALDLRLVSANSETRLLAREAGIPCTGSCPPACATTGACDALMRPLWRPV